MNAWRLDTSNQTMIVASNGGVPFIAYWDSKLSDNDDLEQILNSLIESHNNKEIPNYIDLRDLEIIVKQQNVDLAIRRIIEHNN